LSRNADVGRPEEAGAFDRGLAQIAWPEALDVIDDDVLQDADAAE
jgi:hypothetical protein